MEVTINYNGQAVAVEVTLEVYEFLETCIRDSVDTMLPHMMETAGVTEELKACDPMRWVGLMNTLTAVSYTHLDVYKRQAGSSPMNCPRPFPP